MWVKMRGYPWWPAKVIRPADAPENVQRAQTRKKESTLVHFYASGDLYVSPISASKGIIQSEE